MSAPSQAQKTSEQALTRERRYKAKNQDDPDLDTKVNDLNTFIKGQKFGMLTTVAKSGLLASRAMGLAAQVRSVQPCRRGQYN